MKKEPICPLLRKPCVEHECKWWIHVVGKNPQTGGDMDHWDCSMAWLPVMLTENARVSRGVQAAVESARNEITGRQDILNSAVKVAQQPANNIEGATREQIGER